MQAETDEVERRCDRMRAGFEGEERFPICLASRKYQPRVTQRFGCIEDAKSFCRRFFDWYNQQHHHAGIGLMTPNQVHYGQTDAIHAARQNTLDHAFRNNPERFVNKAPTPPNKPTAAWINPAASTLKIQA